MKTPLASLITLLFLVGAGCVPFTQSAPLALDVTVAGTPKIDPYDGWSTLPISGVLSLRIPPGCRMDAGIESTAIVCPTETNPTPPPEMSISTDGATISVRRWEDLAWEHWNAVIASIRVMTPLAQEIQLTIQK